MAGAAVSNSVAALASKLKSPRKIILLQRGKPVRKVAALTRNFSHGVHTLSLKNVFNQDEEKIQFALGTRALVFGRARKPRMLIFISDVEIRDIYLSLTLGTAKFNQLD